MPEIFDIHQAARRYQRDAAAAGYHPNPVLDAIFRHTDRWIPGRRTEVDQRPSYLDILRDPRVKMGVSAAQSVSGFIILTRCALPGLMLPTVGFWVGIAFGAAMLGAFFVNHQWVGMGACIGASAGLLNSIGVAMQWGTALNVGSLLWIGSIAGLCALIAYALSPDVIQNAYRVGPDGTCYQFPRPLTTASLNRWAEASSISDAEQRVRHNLAQYILSQHPYSCRFYDDAPLLISETFNMSPFDWDTLTELPEGFVIPGSFHLLAYDGARLPAKLRVRGDFVMKDCPNLTQLPYGFQVLGDVDTLGCRHPLGFSEYTDLGRGRLALQVISQREQGQGAKTIHGLVLCHELDLMLERIPEEHRSRYLHIMQQLSPAIRHKGVFLGVLQTLGQLPADQWDALPGLCAPLLPIANELAHLDFAEMFRQVCATPEPLRAERVQEFVGRIRVAVPVRGTNVHEGARDHLARDAAKQLWDKYGAEQNKATSLRTLNSVDAFIDFVRAHPDHLSAYLLESTQEGNSPLERARRTLQALRAHPGEFTLDIPSRQSVSLASLVAMAYDLSSTVSEGTAEQTEAKRHELRRHFVAALSDSLASDLGGTYCAQGVVQRVLTPLQGYYPEVRLDAFQPPSEGDFVSEFARNLARMLDQAAPGSDTKTLVKQEAQGAFDRAKLVYKALPDAHGRISDEAKRTAAARIDKVQRDIMTYLTYDELI